MSERDLARERMLDAEDAASAGRFWNAELDRLLVEMRGDAAGLERAGQFAGGTLMRINAQRIEEALGKVREADTVIARAAGHDLNTSP